MDNSPQSSAASDLWRQAQALFLAALELPRADRAAFLDRECGHQPALLQEVESLLAHDEGDGELPQAFQLAAQSIVGNESLLGQRVGAYQIISELGRGGMGVVYRAVRADDEFRREVAVKVVKRGMDTDAMLERFRQERQILANLDHPFIARLMDGGSAAGRPFFVMELVEGQPVDQYCREQGMSIGSCCRLFLRICEGIAYAHRNLVVHRDLKPSNILVTADGTPKLLDFGVAKLLSADGDAPLTRATQRPLTPEYSSPEHVLGQPATTATDVYALAAILYELVSGGPAHRLPRDRPDQWEQIICQEEVPRLTGRQRQQAGDLETILSMALRKAPERRYPSVEQFAADIERYLNGMPVQARPDTIGYRSARFLRRNRVWVAAAGLVAASLMTATVVSVNEARKAERALQAAERSRQTAESERKRAEDHAHEAESARSTAEREHGLAEEQRNLAQLEAANARREEQRANRRLTQIFELSNHSLFDIHRDIQNLPGATAARRKLVASTLEFLESLSNEAGGDERLNLALGAAYLRIGDVQGKPLSPSLGDSAAALKSYVRAEALVEPYLRRKPPAEAAVKMWIDIETSRASVLNSVGQPAEAAALLQALAPLADRLAAGDDGEHRRADLNSELLFVLQYLRPDEALAHGNKALEDYRLLEAHNPGDIGVSAGQAKAHSMEAMIYLRRDDYGTALSHMREAERLQEAVSGLDANNTEHQRELMIIYGKIGSVLEDSDNPGKDFRVARNYYLKAESIAQALNRADPVNRLAQYDLAQVRLRLGSGATASADRRESMGLLRQATAAFENLARSEPKSVRYKSGLAMAYRAAGDNLRDDNQLAQAVEQYRKSLELSSEVFAIEPQSEASFSQAISVEESLAELQGRMGNWNGSLEYARKAVRRAEANQASGRPTVRNALAKAYLLLAQVELKREGPGAACPIARSAAGIWRVLCQAPGADQAWRRDLAATEALLKECGESH